MIFGFLSLSGNVFNCWTKNIHLIFLEIELIGESIKLKNCKPLSLKREKMSREEKKKAKIRLKAKIQKSLEDKKTLSSNSVFNEDSIGSIRKEYKQLFSSELPKDVHIEMVILKIQYQKEISKIKSENGSIPERTLNNYECALEFNLEGMTNGLQQIMKAKMGIKECVN